MKQIYAIIKIEIFYYRSEFYMRIAADKNKWLMMCINGIKYRL